MAESNNPELAAVDEEYRQALVAFQDARRRLQAAGEARTSAHRMAELKKSQVAQLAAGLSDEEWAQLRQEIRTVEPVEVPLSQHEPQAVTG